MPKPTNKFRNYLIQHWWFFVLLTAFIIAYYIMGGFPSTPASQH